MRVILAPLTCEFVANRDLRELGHTRKPKTRTLAELGPMSWLATGSGPFIVNCIGPGSGRDKCLGNRQPHHATIKSHTMPIPFSGLNIHNIKIEKHWTTPDSSQVLITQCPTEISLTAQSAVWVRVTSVFAPGSRTFIAPGLINLLHSQSAAALPVKCKFEIRSGIVFLPAICGCDIGYRDTQVCSGVQCYRTVKHKSASSAINICFRAGFCAFLHSRLQHFCPQSALAILVPVTPAFVTVSLVLITQ